MNKAGVKGGLLTSDHSLESLYRSIRNTGLYLTHTVEMITCQNTALLFLTCKFESTVQILTSFVNTATEKMWSSKRK